MTLCDAYCTCVAFWSGSPRGPRCHRRLLPAGERSLAPVRKLWEDCGLGARAQPSPHLFRRSTRWQSRLWSSWAGSCRRSWSSSSGPRSRDPWEEKREAPRSRPWYKHGAFYHRRRSPGGMERRHSRWPHLYDVGECNLKTPFCDRCAVGLEQVRSQGGAKYSDIPARNQLISPLLPAVLPASPKESKVTKLSPQPVAPYGSATASRLPLSTRL